MENIILDLFFYRRGIWREILRDAQDDWQSPDDRRSPNYRECRKKHSYGVATGIHSSHDP